MRNSSWKKIRSKARFLNILLPSNPLWIGSKHSSNSNFLKGDAFLAVKIKYLPICFSLAKESKSRHAIPNPEKLYGKISILHGKQDG